MQKYQLLCVCIAVIGVTALAVVYFTPLFSLTALRVCGSVTLLGLVGNAVFSVLRVRDSWYGKS